MIEFRGEQYHVTYTVDWDVYGHMVEFRHMDDPSGHVLMRVTGWDDEEDLREVIVAPDVDPRFAEFAANHARDLMGLDVERPIGAATDLTLIGNAGRLLWLGSRATRARLGAGGHVGGQDVVRVAVEVVAGPVVTHRGAWIRVAG